jgi:hypothetical protein
MRWTFALLLIAAAASAAIISGDEIPARQVIASIDCTKDYGPDRYFGLGEVRVVQSEAGSYREAGPSPDSRFG